MQSWKYVAPAILVPFMFVLDESGTALLLMGSTKALANADWLQIAWITFTAIVGVIALAGGLQGWFLAKTNIFERWILILSGVALTYSSNFADIAGFIGFGLVVLMQLIRNKKSARAVT
jgi:TRAP-type uncharacterized transport system fused permease subunit